MFVPLYKTQTYISELKEWVCEFSIDFIQVPSEWQTKTMIT